MVRRFATCFVVLCMALSTFLGAIASAKGVDSQAMVQGSQIVQKTGYPEQETSLMDAPLLPVDNDAEGLPKDIQDIIARIQALPDPQGDNIEDIEAQKGEIQALYVSVEQLTDEETVLVNNRDKLSRLLKFVLHPLEEASNLTGEVESVIYTGPAPFSSIGQVTAQNNYVLAYVQQKYGNGDAVAGAISASVNSEVAAVAWQIIGNKTSKADRAQAIYTWVTENIYYDYDYYYHGRPRPGTSAVSTLQTRITVCEGYANLLRAMLNAVGVPCLYASGAAINYPEAWSSSNFSVPNHAWNIINTGSGWFYADSTWDSRNYYEYGVKHGPYPRRNDYYNPAISDFSAEHNTLGIERVGIGDGANINNGLVYRNGKYYFYLYGSGVQLFSRFIVLNEDIVWYSTYPLLDSDILGEMMYFGSDGVAVAGWYTYDSKKKFYFDPANGCQARTGWLTLEGKRYYFDPISAVMVIGQVQIDGITYQFDSNGAWLSGGPTQTGWQVVNGAWYYYINGQPARGWLEIDGYWRYFDEGKVLYGIHFVDGYYRYFGEGGIALAPGLYILDGYYRYIGDGGILYPPGVYFLDGAWRCIIDGAILPPPGVYYVAGYYRYVGEGGILVAPGWYFIGGAWRYFAEGGIALYGWHYVDGATRYFGDGSIALYGWHTIDGMTSWFEGGVRVRAA